MATLGTKEKNIEALLSAIGESLTSLAGFVSTRLRLPLAAAASSVAVETVAYFPTSGVALIDGVSYSYASIGGTPVEPTLEGLATVAGPGAIQEHEIRSEVLEYSRELSLLDHLRGEFFLGTAGSGALSTIGRDLGVDRPPGLESDVAFRAVVEALAAPRRGTVHAIEQALTAFFGAGNFTIFEDFEAKNNTVFLQIAGGISFAFDPNGKAYQSFSEAAPYTSATLSAPASKTPLTVMGLRLAPENFYEELRTQKPSALSEVRYSGDSGVPVWVYQGTLEATAVTVLLADGGTNLFDASTGGNPSYRHLARIRPESAAAATARFNVTAASTISATATDGPQLSLALHDGERALTVGVVAGGAGDYQIGFIDGSGAFITSTARFDASTDVYYDVDIRKDPTSGLIALHVDGNLVATEPATSFAVSVANYVEFGCPGTAAGILARFMSCGFSSTTPTDFWNERGTNAKTLAANPDELDTQGTAIVASDVGKPLRIFGATQTNAQLGNNNFRGVVVTATSPDLLTVDGEVRKLAFTENANPSRIKVANDDRAFSYPDDLGSKITLIGGANPGPHTIEFLLDPVTLLPVTGSSQQFVSACEVTGVPSFTTETELDWKLSPAFVDENPPGSGLGWELSNAGTVSGASLATRSAIPLVGFGPSDIIVDLLYTVVVTAQMLLNENIAAGQASPWYLAPGPMGVFAAFLDELTVAGVIPEITFG